MRYRAVLFDLLTALLDSWTVWNRAAGSEAAGRRWRAKYLELTYGCGGYEPYDSLVAQAAVQTGLDAGAAARLEADWDALQPWSGAQEMLDALSRTHRLGVVTNCSERLGRRAAARLGCRWETLVTAERAGFYKPDPRPYRMALDELGLPAGEVLFVAGSGFDLFGTAQCGLDTYWHNRVGLEPPAGAPLPRAQSRDLSGVVPLATEEAR